MTSIQSEKQLREFGFLIGLGFPFLIGWLIPFISGHEINIWTILVSIPSIVLALISPKSLRRPYKAWMWIGHILGWANSRIILGLVFLLVLIPISCLMRIFQYDPLRQKKVLTSSYRESKSNSQIDLTRIF